MDAQRRSPLIRLTAHAKINWFLEITGKLSNGYHTLSTVFQTVSLGDRLTLRLAPELRLTCSDPLLPVDERNLALKAALGLRALLKEKKGAAIHLEKKVPMGAGLGGGSADAASVLKGLLKLWRRRVNPAALQRLAVSLGADVPFFLTGGTCLAKGIGDRLKPLPPVAKTWLVIVWPGFGVSTKDAYAQVQWPWVDKVSLGSITKAFDPRQKLFNRFESLVFPAHPALPQLKKELVVRGASAAFMSGSGSAMIGIVPSAAVGKKMLAPLKSKYPDSWIAHTV